MCLDNNVELNLIFPPHRFPQSLPKNEENSTIIERKIHPTHIVHAQTYCDKLKNKQLWSNICRPLSQLKINDDIYSVTAYSPCPLSIA